MPTEEAKEIKKVPTKKKGKRTKATEEAEPETVEPKKDIAEPEIPSGEAEKIDESNDEASGKGAKKGAKKVSKKGKATVAVADNVEDDKDKKAPSKKGAKVGAVEPKKRTRTR